VYFKFLQIFAPEALRPTPAEISTKTPPGFNNYVTASGVVRGAGVEGACTRGAWLLVAGRGEATPAHEKRVLFGSLTRVCVVGWLREVLRALVATHVLPDRHIRLDC